jgi:hypothetical protein
VFFFSAMAPARNKALSWILGALICLMSAIAGCYVGYWSYSEHWQAADSALGEEHQIDFAPKDALSLTEDALRGDGILFEVQPDNSIIPLWRPADPNIPGGFFPSLFGVKRQYRYEISIVPEGSHKSKIIVNVRTEGIPDSMLASYKASARFDLFHEIDELAAKYPPPSTMPTNGGVNFTLLPGENLEGLAQRVTGNANNWRQIAKDNGIASPTDVTPFESIWVRNNLLRPVGK